MKKYFLGLIAVLFALGTVAFTTVKQSFEPVYWEFVGTDATDIDEVKDPLNYVELTGSPCSGSALEVCNIVAESDNGSPTPRPVITSALEEELEDLLLSQQSNQPNVRQHN